MTFYRRLYKYTGYQDSVWTLEPGYVYVIRSIIMDAQNDGTADTNGVFLYGKTYDEQYIQIELGLIPSVACVNDRAMLCSYVLKYDYNPYIYYIGNAWPTRANVAIEYDKYPMEQTTPVPVTKGPVV